jgi:hypothetical protein
MNTTKLVTTSYYWGVKRVIEAAAKGNYLGSHGDVHYYLATDGYGSYTTTTCWKFDVSNYAAENAVKLDWNKFEVSVKEDMNLSPVFAGENLEVVQQLEILLSTVTMSR